jgi:PKD repeat protein
MKYWWLRPLTERLGLVRRRARKPVRARLRVEALEARITPAASITGLGGSPLESASLAVNGSGFTAASVVQFNGVNAPTTFLGSTQLTAINPEEGSYTVTVFDPTSGISNGVSFTCVDPNVTINANSGNPFITGNETTPMPPGSVIGTFFDPGNPAGTIDQFGGPEYRVGIDWGDNTGTTIDSLNNPNSFVYAGSNTWQVLAPTHTYSEDGQYAVRLTMQHHNLLPVGPVQTDTITVNDPNVTINANSGALLAPIIEPGSTPGFMPIGTFTDSGNPSGTLDSNPLGNPEYRAVINWGDNTSTSFDSTINPTAFMYVGSNTWRVLAPAHTYSEEGQYAVTLSVQHHNLLPVGPVQTDIITVTDPNVTINANSGAFLTPISEGGSTPAFMVIGIFTDSGNPSSTIDVTQTSANPEYKAVINWGDGSSTTVDTFNNGNAFTFMGGNTWGIVAPSHTYAEEGNYPITLTVTHDGLPSVGPVVTDFISVNDPNITVNFGGPPISVAENTATPANTAIGAFTDTGNPTGTLDASQTSTNPEYKAVILWGDGSSDTVDSFNNPAAFQFVGSNTWLVLAPAHVYAEEGYYTIALAMTHHSLIPTGPTQTVNVTVNDAPVFVNGPPLTLPGINEGTAIPAGSVIGSFTDPGTNGILDSNQISFGPEYQVMINWGDGSSVPLDSFHNSSWFNFVGNHTWQVVVPANAPGHIYTEPGTYSISFSLVHHNQFFTGGPGATITVADPNVTVNAGSGSVPTLVNEQAPLPINSIVGTFTDPGNPSGTISFQQGGTPEYRAIINWGDGSTTAIDSIFNTGAFQYIGNNTWQIPAFHTYAEEGTYNVTLTVFHKGLAGVGPVQTNTITVLDPNVTVQPSPAVLQVNESGLVGGLFATFTDPGITANNFPFLEPIQTALVPEYTVVFNWGDGNSSTVDSFHNPGSFFRVGPQTWQVPLPPHAYAEEGTYAVSVTVTHYGLAPVGPVQIGSVNVIDPNVTVTPNSGAALASITEATSTPANTVLGMFVDVGIPGGGIVGNPGGVIDSDQTSLQPEYQAVINWGDGTSDTVDSFNNPSAFHYVGGITWQVFGPAHTYAEAGAYNITLTLVHDGLSPVGPVQTDTITVSDAALTGSAATADGGLEGVTLATLSGANFTDENTSAPASDFSTSIDWGDSTPLDTSATVSGTAGSYTVNGSHLYAGAGTYNFTITVIDQDGSSTTITGSTTVADAALTDITTASTVNAIEGVAADGQVLATFTDANPNASASDFTPMVTSWGAGATLIGTPAVQVVLVGRDGGVSTWNVVGNPAYAEPGSFTVSVTVMDVGGQSISTSTNQTTFLVADAPLTDITTAANFAATEGNHTGTQVLMTFTDGNPNAPASDFPLANISVNWGGALIGTPTMSIQRLDATTWQVLGDAVYAEKGTFAVTVTVLDVDGGSVSSQTGNTTFIVADAPLTNTTPVTTKSVLWHVNTGPLVLATFSDANPLAALSDYTAIIYWGDGTQSVGIITLQSRTATESDWAVIGNHNYKDSASFGATYTVLVAITDVDGSILNVLSTTLEVGPHHHHQPAL